MQNKKIIVIYLDGRRTSIFRSLTEDKLNF